MTIDADLPGYRRLIRIEQGNNHTTAALEDDFHRMIVSLDHDGGRITAIDGQTERAPWNTCAGAQAVLRDTFTGVELADAAALGSRKRANCTHLYDLALLAAAHALDRKPSTYEINVSDPVDGRVVAEIRLNGSPVMRWELHDDVILEPSAPAGLHLVKLREWIASLPPAQAEAARLLQWASLVAHGRAIPMESQSDASQMPPNCYTFQPERTGSAKRTGERFDFSQSGRTLLEGFDPGHNSLETASSYSG